MVNLLKNQPVGKSDRFDKEGARMLKEKFLTTILDMIISLGYRINSIQATHFRQWATARLKEYIIKGFTIDDERLKQLEEAIIGKSYSTASVTSDRLKR